MYMSTSFRSSSITFACFRSSTCISSTSCSITVLVVTTGGSASCVLLSSCSVRLYLRPAPSFSLFILIRCSLACRRSTNSPFSSRSIRACSARWASASYVSRSISFCSSSALRSFASMATRARSSAAVSLARSSPCFFAFSVFCVTWSSCTAILALTLSSWLLSPLRAAATTAELFLIFSGRTADFSRAVRLNSFSSSSRSRSSASSASFTVPSSISALLSSTCLCSPSMSSISLSISPLY
mmetsp:Transcript_30877/g.67442  ORF Transcript_30877/g.67442 Transcript_30877/m.67442 type:complete len:241 (+) Transcript_30877:1446-2168(+)